MFVHIVEDDAAVARTLARLVTRAGWDVAVHESADAFLAAVDGLPFGCILSDVRMPGTTGLELVEILRARCPEWPVIMMSGYADVNAAIRSFRSGAIHFLEKPFKRAALLAALDEAETLVRSTRTEPPPTPAPGPVPGLTERENQILEALSRGLQSKTIAWELGISTRTVEMHRSNILLKLGARNTSQAVALLKSGDAASAREQTRPAA